MQLVFRVSEYIARSSRGSEDIKILKIGLEKHANIWMPIQASKPPAPRSHELILCRKFCRRNHKSLAPCLEEHAAIDLGCWVSVGSQISDPYLPF
ncbi:hypothetical protein EVAR_57583_1 [Eumeta japonica]|uniref:Uncharacterized protein n=1 Tax=Eumeta variegata TaxID=151549 RepID=A0A4C1Z3H5_EUMVA|nr:hypothetical protein EVAR_57583_1 [Eumeta japonica]